MNEEELYRNVIRSSIVVGLVILVTIISSAIIEMI